MLSHNSSRGPPNKHACAAGSGRKSIPWRAVCVGWGVAKGSADRPNVPLPCVSRTTTRRPKVTRCRIEDSQMCLSEKSSLIPLLQYCVAVRHAACPPANASYVMLALHVNLAYLGLRSILFKIVPLHTRTRRNGETWHAWNQLKSILHPNTMRLHGLGRARRSVERARL